jgi:hypothetical protein
MNHPLVLLERLCIESGDTGTPFPALFMWRWDPGITMAWGRPWGGGEVDETELFRRARVAVRVGPIDGARERERDLEVPMGEGECRLCAR